MKKFFIFLTVLFLWSGFSWAIDVQIGTGTSTNTYYPINTCYNYSYSQQIYLASEITAGGGANGNITKVRFYYSSGGTTYTNWSDWTIYLGNSTKATYSSSTDWVAIGSLTQVFTGPIPTPVTGTWIEITLDTPFNYTGDNLIVAVDENSSGYSCTAAWGSFASGSDRGILYYSDGTNPDPSAPPTANNGPTATIAQIQLDMAASGPENPSPFAAVAASSTEIDLDWIQNGDSDNVLVAWSSDGVFGTPVNGTTYAATDPITGGGTVLFYGSALHYDHMSLTANTQYYYKAWSYDGSEYSIGIADDATTFPGTHSFPLTEDFESGFVFFGNNPGNDVDWILNSSILHGGLQSAHNVYSASDENILHETGIFDLSSTTTPILNFWQIAKTEGTYDKCYIEISTDAGANYTMLPASTYQGSGSGYPSVTYFDEDDYTIWGTGTETPDNTWWKEETFSLLDYKVADVRIRFRLTSDGSGQRAGWYLDDIEVMEAPLVPTFTIDPTTFDFGTAVAGTSSTTETFTISNTGGGTLTINSGGITLTGTNLGEFSLTDFNTYPINLGSFESTTVDVAFTPATEGAKTADLQIVHNAVGSPSTATLTGNALPEGTLFESFEGANFPPPGWVIDPSTWTQTSVGYDGVKSAYNYNYGAITDERLMTPKVSISSSDEISFFARKTSSGTDESIQIQFSTDKVTWTNIGTAATLTSTWTQYTVAFTAIPIPGDYYLAFAANSSYIYSNYIYLDYLMGPVISPELPGPAVIDAPADATTSIDINTTLTWTPPITGGIPDGYKLYFGTDGGGTVSPTTIENGSTQTSPYTPASTLAYSTIYYWQVIPYNSEGDATGCPIWSYTTMADPTLTPPVAQDFEGTFPPENYSRYLGLLADPITLTSTTIGWVQDDWRNVTSPVNKAAKLNIYGTSRNHWLMTPPINLGVGGYQLEFDLTLVDYNSSNPPDLTGDDDKFAVVISTDNGVTWTTANTLQLWDNDPLTTSSVYNDINPNGEYIVIDIASYTGIVKIAFYGESTVSNADNDLMIDNLQVREPPSCPGPLTLTVTGITATQAVLGWTEEGLASIWEVEYGVSPYTFTGIPTFSTTNNPHTLLGLDPATTYEWKVRSDCTHDLYSDWSSTSIFTTDCVPYPAPFGENFDGVATPDLPVCWSTYINSISTYATAITYSSTSAPSQPNYFRWYNSSDASAELVLISPQLAGGTGLLADKRIKFTAYTSDVTNAYQLVVGTMSDPLDYVTFTPYTTLSLTSSFTEYTVSFDGYAGDDNYIAITPIWGSTYDYVYLDDFIYESCFSPSNLIVGNSTQTGADLSWTAEGTATNWDLYIVPGGDPAPEIGTTPTVDNTQLNPYTWANGLAATYYDAYVRSDCGADNTDVSVWVGPITFRTALPYATLPIVEDFEVPADGFNITANTPNNGTDWVVIDTMSYGGNSAAFNVYEANDVNILDLLVKVDLTAKINAQLTFWHIAKTEGGYDDCFVDISTDGGATFDPIPAEYYYGSGAYDGLFDEDSYPDWGTGDTPIVDSMWMQETFVLTAYNTFTDVTFRFRLDADGSTQRAGWMIDDIKIEELACPPVYDITLDEVFPTTATISWSSVSGSSNIEWDTAGFVQGAGNMISGVTSPQDLFPLEANATYDVYIQDNCGSFWTYYQFSTECIDCPAGSIAEGEACGDSINNGCIDDISYTTLVSDGVTICGNVWADGSAKDLDFFQLDLATGYNRISIEIATDIDLEFGLVEQTIPGVPGCANTTGSITNWFYPNECDTATFVIDIEAAGTYYFYLAPDFTTSNLCPGSRYWASWTVTQLTAPLAIVDPLFIDETLPLDFTSSQSLTIGNAGEYQLDYSAIISNYGFGTKDDSKAVLLTEDFESGTFPPTGWSVVNNGGTCDWYDLDALESSPEGNLTGGTGNFADADSDACGSGGSLNTYMLSPAFDLSGYTFASVTFATNYNDIGSAGDYATFDVSIDGGTIWTNLFTWDEDHSGTTLVSLDAYAGQANVILRWQYQDDGWDWYWQVDDVVVEGLNAPIGWLTLDGSPSVSGTIIEGAPDDIIDVGFDATGLPLGTYTADIELTTNEPASDALYTIPVTLVVAPSYNVTGTLTYANSGSTPMDLVDVSLMEGPSTKGSTTTDAAGSFSFATILDGSYTYMASTSKQRGGTNILDAINTRQYLGGGYPMDILQQAAADVNNNSNVDILDAIFMQQSLSGPLPGGWTAPDYLFENPAVNVAGSDLNVDFRTLSSGDPNGSFTPPAYCAPPTGLGVSNIGATSADLNWLDENNSEIEWGIQGFTLGTGTVVPGATSPYSLIGLSESTSYDFYVRNDCGGNSQSDWVGPYTFSTTLTGGNTCADAVVIAGIPFIQTGLTTCGYGDDYNYLTDPGMCYYYGNGEDFVFEYTPSADITVDINISNNLTWTGVNVSEGCPDVGTCVDYSGSSTSVVPPLANLALTGGVTYYIVVGTWPTPDCTPFDISITETPVK